MYLTSAGGDGQVLEMDLGATPEQREENLRPVVEELGEIWRSVKALVEQNDLSKWTHCDRSFCDCHVLRKKFRDKTLFHD